MASFYAYDEVASRRPTPEKDILWLAGQISQLQPFVERAAVLHGSVAWGKPSWRSDIDIALFRRKDATDLAPAIEDLRRRYEASTKGQYIVPRVDILTVGAESEHLVTRANLVGGSAPIREKQTVSEYFDAIRLRLADHIGSLAALKGDPWTSFHSTYLAGVDLGRDARRAAIRTYVSSFVATWLQQPLRGARSEDDPLDDQQLEALGHAENFPIHLMRQLTGERGSYPRPDRDAEVRSAFAGVQAPSVQRVQDALHPFFGMAEAYATIVASCGQPDAAHLATDYYRQLRALADPLPFGDIEQAVWEYLDA